MPWERLALFELFLGGPDLDVLRILNPDVCKFFLVYYKVGIQDRKNRTLRHFFAIVENLYSIEVVLSILGNQLDRAYFAGWQDVS